jgi:hypothetical protein
LAQRVTKKRVIIGNDKVRGGGSNHFTLHEGFANPRPALHPTERVLFPADCPLTGSRMQGYNLSSDEAG